jgi:hypothetical protein
VKVLNKCSSVTLVLLASTALAQSTVDRTQRFLGHGTLHLPVPATWRVATRAQLGAPPTLVFTLPTGEEFQVLLSVFAPAPGREDVLEPEALRDGLRRGGQAARAQSVGKELEIKQLPDSENLCFYFTLTDRDPKESYRYLTQAHARIGTLAAAITILQRSPDPATQALAFGILRGARLTK